MNVLKKSLAVKKWFSIEKKTMVLYQKQWLYVENNETMIYNGKTIKL